MINRFRDNQKWPLLEIMPSAACPLVAGGSNVSPRYNFSDLSKFKLRRSASTNSSGSATSEHSRGPMKGKLVAVNNVTLH